MKKISSLIILALIVVGVIFALIFYKKETPVSTESTGNSLEKFNLIHVSTPLPNEQISSPLTIKGEARGNWFFEASFPVILTDWDGLIIAQGVAKAKGDWMTTEFVPFEATLTFKVDEKLYSNHGSLILKKDNPSGLPQNDDALEIPIIYSNQTSKIVGVSDYKNAEYVIDGQKVKLENGVAETAVATGSASKIITRYFGNEIKTDLDGDGRKDVAFILTQERGGSGTFFYAVAALNTDNGYIGSDGYFLGDRIAPQNTNLSNNPRQKYVVVFNYADRATGEPMTTKPSVGKSVYLKLDPKSMQWGIVQPDFEGEVR